MNNVIKGVIIALVFLAGAGTHKLLSPVEPMDHAAMQMPAGDDGPSSQAYRAANDEMHAAMNIEFTGNSDVDFARGMIAHHEGAVTMAKIELQHGTDAELKELAEQIIAAQEPEIAQMKEWLRVNVK